MGTNQNRGTVSDYNFNLLYDFDPGVNTDESEHGVFPLGLLSSPDATTIQDSENLGFGFFNIFTSQPGFDPDANGEYTFSLRAIRSSVPALEVGLSTIEVGESTLGQSAIRVNVGEVAAVPEPSSMALLGMGLIGLLLCAPLRARRIRDDG